MAMSGVPTMNPPVALPSSTRWSRLALSSNGTGSTFFR
jgi:hypothetical protein